MKSLTLLTSLVVSALLSSCAWSDNLQPETPVTADETLIQPSAAVNNPPDTTRYIEDNEPDSVPIFFNVTVDDWEDAE